jgi:hypothetical protein
MTEQSRWLSAVGVLIAAFATVPAAAQPADSPGKGAEKSAEKAENKAAKAEARAEDKAARADAKAEKAEARADRKAGDQPGKADEKSDAKGEHGRGPGHMPGTDPNAEHGADRHAHRGYRGLGADFRDGKVTKAELKDRIAAMRANANERRKEHREGLRKRWGATLAHPACREELRHHARREAFLSRALFLAQTEVAAKDKDKLVERIQKLVEKENERHSRAMERLKSSPATAAPAAAAPAAAPATPPSPAPAPAAPAKAGEK